MESYKLSPGFSTKIYRGGNGREEWDRKDRQHTVTTALVPKYLEHSRWEQGHRGPKSI